MSTPTVNDPAFVLLPNGDRLRADTIQTIRQLEEDPGFGIPPRVVVDFQSDSDAYRRHSCIVLKCTTVQEREELAASLWVAVAAAREALAHDLRTQRDELLAALQELRDWYLDHTGLPAVRANAAIAKAQSTPP